MASNGPSRLAAISSEGLVKFVRSIKAYLVANKHPSWRKELASFGCRLPNVFDGGSSFAHQLGKCFTMVMLTHLDQWIAILVE